MKQIKMKDEQGTSKGMKTILFVSKIINVILVILFVACLYFMLGIIVDDSGFTDLFLPLPLLGLFLIFLSYLIKKGALNIAIQSRLLWLVILGMIISFLVITPMLLYLILLIGEVYFNWNL